MWFISQFGTEAQFTTNIEKSLINLKIDLILIWFVKMGSLD